MNRNQPITGVLPFTNALDLDGASVTFMRTVRVPRVEGRSSELPAGLGHFPLYRVADFQGNVPPNWQVEGHFIPMYPQEAMWMSFTLTGTQPLALMIAAGLVNAVTGDKITPTLAQGPQNYVVVPTQPWLDGWKATQGEKVYQFVAAQLGDGQTAEEQILGTADNGGIQFGVFKPKIALMLEQAPVLEGFASASVGVSSYSYVGGVKGMSFRGTPSASYSSFNAMPQNFNVSANLGAGQDARSMGLGAGGSIRQKVYEDPHLVGRAVGEVWHDVPSTKGYVYIVHSNDFLNITGQAAPPSPITYQTYKQQGLPWFVMQDGTWNDAGGGEALDNLKPVEGSPHPTDLNAFSVDPKTKDLW